MTSAMNIATTVSVCAVIFALLLAPTKSIASEPEIRPQIRKTDTLAIDTKAEKANKIRCKKIQMTGTHFPKRVCKKQSEWDAMRNRALELVKNRNREAQAQNRNQRY